MDRKKKLPKSLTIAGVLVLVLIVVAIAAIAPIYSATDGTGSYTGVKLEAARSALQFDQGEYSPALFSNWTKAHVDSVVPSSQSKDAQGKALRCTDDPNNIQYYSVTVRRVWLFGTTYGKHEYRLCNVTG